MNKSNHLPRLRSLRRKARPLEGMSLDELRFFFGPDPKFDQVVRYAKGPVARIALFYHAAYMESFGQSPPFAPIPEALAKHIASLLGEEAPTPFPYPEAQSTFFHHEAKAMRILGWRTLGQAVRRALEHRLAAEARRSDDRDYLEEKLVEWFHEARVLNPGPTRVTKMIAQALTHARNWIAEHISSLLSSAHLEAIDGLRKIRPGTHRTSLQWLKDPIGMACPKTLLDILDRREFIRSLALPAQPFEQVHPDMRRALREVVETYSVDNLYTDFPTDRRRAVVGCYLHERKCALVDLAVEAFDGIVQKMYRLSEAELARDQEKRAPRANEILLMFRTMARTMVDEENVPDLLVRPATYSQISKEDLLRAIGAVEEIIRPKDYNCFDYLRRRYTYLRTFFPRFLAAMEFEGAPSAGPILEAVAALRDWNDRAVRKLPAVVPLAFVPEKWRAYVMPADGKIDRRYYELCLMTELHRALQATEIWAVGGRRYGNVEDLLISPVTWNEIRETVIEELRLPKDPEEWLGKVLPSLRAQIETTARNLPSNQQTFVLGNRVHLHALQAAPEPESLRKLRERVKASWPQVRIQDLLVEVDSWLGLSHLFKTLRGRKSSEFGLGPGLLAGLIAKGCNIGMQKMSVLTPGVTSGTLRRVDESFLHERALRHAFEALLRAHRDLPLSHWLGDPAVSMSDQLRVASRVGTIRAALQPQAFAPGERAITYYWHVSHFGPAYSAQVFGHDRDAAYVLDEIFKIRSELPILEHFTDTHGSTLVTFALAYLLGVEFCPRIKQIHETNLYFPPGLTVEGPLKFHYEGPVDVELIKRHWDDVLRILGSIQRGYTSARLLTLRLSSYARQNPLFRALREVGRIFETRYIMKYYDDPAMRRRVNTGLTRMENFNFMARYLYFARRGENWEREFEQQVNRASALLVLANACVLWNTVHLTELVQQLRLEGVLVSPDEFRQVSPYAHEHIVPFGEYRFDLRRKERREAYLNARQL